MLVYHKQKHLKVKFGMIPYCHNCLPYLAIDNVHFPKIMVKMLILLGIDYQYIFFIRSVTMYYVYKLKVVSMVYTGTFVSPPLDKYLWFKKMLVSVILY